MTHKSFFTCEIKQIKAQRFWKASDVSGFKHGVDKSLEPTLFPEIIIEIGKALERI